METQEYYNFADAVSFVIGEITGTQSPSLLNLETLTDEFEDLNLDVNTLRRAKFITKQALEYAVRCEAVLVELSEKDSPSSIRLARKYRVEVDKIDGIRLRGCVELMLSPEQMFRANTSTPFRSWEEASSCVGFVDPADPEFSFNRSDDPSINDHERQHIINRFIMSEKRYRRRLRIPLLDKYEFQTALDLYFPKGFSDDVNTDWFHGVLFPALELQMITIKDEITAFMTDPNTTQESLTKILLNSNSYQPYSKNSPIYEEAGVLSTWHRVEAALEDLKNVKEGTSNGQLWSQFVADYEISTEDHTWIETSINHISVSELSGMVKRANSEKINNFFPLDYYHQLVKKSVKEAFRLREFIPDNTYLANLLAIVPLHKWSQI